MDKELVLLQVCDLAKQWPNLSAIHDLAMAELGDAAVEAQKELDSRAAEAAKAKAKAEAEAAAKRKALADQEAKAAESPVKVIPTHGATA